MQTTCIVRMVLFSHIKPITYSFKILWTKIKHLILNVESSKSILVRVVVCLSPSSPPADRFGGAFPGTSGRTH